MPDNLPTYAVGASHSATKDVEKIYRYLLNSEGKEAAEKMFARIREAFESLRQLPLRGKIVPELKGMNQQNYREILIGVCRIIYQVAGERVVIAAVVDTRRSVQDVLVKRGLHLQ